MKIYFGGVVQGSRKDNDNMNQDYRIEMTECIKNAIPDIEISDPTKLFQIKSGKKSAEEIKTIFNIFFQEIRSSNIFIGYFPVASNGTAIELYYAKQLSLHTISYTNMLDNWAIQCFSDKVVNTNEELTNHLKTLNHIKFIK